MSSKEIKFVIIKKLKQINYYNFISKKLYQSILNQINFELIQLNYIKN
jgi:hypothetical protein